MEQYFIIKSKKSVGANEIKEALALTHIKAEVEKIQVQEGRVHDLLIPKERIMS